MAKRKSKKNKPNIPQEVLDRVREEQGGEGDADEKLKTAEEARKEAERRAARAARRAARKQQGAVGGEKPKRDELNAVTVAEMLANPTTEVDEDAMRVQYAYVLADLRTMGILAAILLVVLLVLGFLL